MSEKKIHPIKIDTIEELDDLDDFIYSGFANTMQSFTRIQNILYDRLEHDPENSALQNQYDYVEKLRETADRVFAPLKYGLIWHEYTDEELERTTEKTLIEMKEKFKELKGKLVQPIHRPKNIEPISGTLTGIGCDLIDYFYILKKDGQEIFITCLEGIELV